jgi:PIN domain nuclease of toxin-antitoxin system
VQDFEGYLSRDGFMHLPLSSDHGLRAGLLPGPLRDPFDRMLIAVVEKLFLVSNEKIFDQYGIRRIW